MPRTLLLTPLGRDPRTPLGWRADGRPIYPVAGGDDLDTLIQQRDDLLTRLANPPEGADVDAMLAEADDLAQRIEAHNAQVQRANEQRARLLGLTPASRANPPAGPPRPEEPPADAPLVRAGVQFVRSPELAAYRQGGGRGQMQPVAVQGEVRALFATTNNPSNPQRLPGLFQAVPDAPLRIIDLIDRQPMDGTTIEWVREDVAPNAAAEVAEGAVKPEATFTLTLVQDTAATIAHWVNLTRQALADDGQLRGYVEGRLGFGLMKRLNNQILSGNGTAPNLRGILNTTGIGTYTAGSATERALVSIRKAKTVAQLSEFEPDTVALNPVDWEAVELTADNNGALMVASNVQATLAPRIWGLNVVADPLLTGTSFGVTGGTFLVGAFREGATLWERTGVELYLTDSHASNFTSNILTLLAELRAGLSVWRPKAFVKGTFGASRA